MDASSPPATTNNDDFNNLENFDDDSYLSSRDSSSSSAGTPRIIDAIGKAKDLDQTKVQINFRQMDRKFPGEPSISEPFEDSALSGMIVFSQRDSTRNTVGKYNANQRSGKTRKSSRVRKGLHACQVRGSKRDYFNNSIHDSQDNSGYGANLVTRGSAQQRSSANDSLPIVKVFPLSLLFKQPSPQKEKVTIIGGNK